MTNSKPQNKYRYYPLKLEPIIRDDKDAHLRYEMLNSQPNISTNKTHFKQYSRSFAPQLLHDQARNVTLPEPTGQFMPCLSLKLPPCEASFINTIFLYHSDLSVEMKEQKAFFTSTEAEHVCFHHTIEPGKYTGPEFYPDAFNQKMAAAFANAVRHTSGAKVDKAISGQSGPMPKICIHPLSQTSQFAPKISFKGREVTAQRKIAQQSGVQFAQGFFWSTLFRQEK